MNKRRFSDTAKRPIEYFDRPRVFTFLLLEKHLSFRLFTDHSTSRIPSGAEAY